MAENADGLALAPARAGGLAPRVRTPIDNSLRWGVVLGCGAWMAAAAPVVGAAYVVFGGILFWLRRAARGRTAEVLQLDALHLAGRHDEIALQIAKVERMLLDRHQRGAVEWYRYRLAWRRGDLDAAAPAAGRCLQLFDPPRTDAMKDLVWRTRVDLANLLLELGQIREAQRLVDRVLASSIAKTHRDVTYALELHRAVANGRNDGLGSDDELHARAREMLVGQHTGLSIAAIARIFEDRGRAEVAAELLAAVTSRIPDRAVSELEYPRMWAWLAPRLAELSR